MYWKHIWIGAAIGGAVLWLFDAGNLILTQRIMVPEPNLLWGELMTISGSLVLPCLVTGFLLSWLYALARPRLGPGPATALLVGTIGFAFSNTQFVSLSIWTSYPTAALIQLGTLWLKFAAATSLAGWQYIEKAP